MPRHSNATRWLLQRMAHGYLRLRACGPALRRMRRSIPRRLLRTAHQHRAVLLQVLVRAAWWTALVGFALLGTDLWTPSYAVDAERELVLGASLGMLSSAFVVVFGPTRLWRSTASGLLLGHGAVALLAWAAIQ